MADQPNKTANTPASSGSEQTPARDRMQQARDKRNAEAGTQQSHVMPEPGESNDRASRRDPNTDPASGKPIETATARTGGAAGAKGAGAAKGAGTRKVRMTRDEGGHTNGQEVDLPAADAQRLIDSGAAQAI
jgi:hypothetical protein